MTVMLYGGGYGTPPTPPACSHPIGWPGCPPHTLPTLPPTIVTAPPTTVSTPPTTPGYPTPTTPGQTYPPTTTAPPTTVTTAPPTTATTAPPTDTTTAPPTDTTTAITAVPVTPVGLPVTGDANVAGLLTGAGISLLAGVALVVIGLRLRRRAQED